MFLLRETERSVTDVCLDVGFTTLGTFSRTFRAIGLNGEDRDIYVVGVAWNRPCGEGERSADRVLELVLVETCGDMFR
ncbi:MAG TPA: hypothetical protein VIX73_32960 [Kofleriaceae bacterium]|jgi:hypothetical protein